MALGMRARAEATYELLAEFEKPGNQVVAPLAAHSDGAYYGVASANGAFNLGTVFKVTAAGALTTLHSFSGLDGSGPAAKLAVGTDLALYGTTASGGANGFGTVFKITTAGVFTQLVDFTGTAGAAPGSVPHALMLHADGNFYGVSQAGGASGFGTVFKMTAAGAITTLVNFSGTAGIRPGAEALGPLAVSGSLLYGVTRGGGSGGFGTIFEVSTTGAWRLLGEFTGTSGVRPGVNPAGGLLMNTDGLLYGTTEFGGTNGFGVAFSTTTAVTPAFTTLRHFADASGSQPTGTLVRGSDGLLYGSTANGGANGLGTLFKITTGGTHTLLESFTGESGAFPGSAMRGGLTGTGGLLFYGVTSSGGPGNLGSVFSINSTGTFTSLGGLSLIEGWMPCGAPVDSGTGELWFPIAGGGTAGGGNLMSVDTSGSLSVVAPLGGALGTFADGALTTDGTSFYGVTAKGGASARGTMFRYTPGFGVSLVSTYTTSAGSLAEGPLVLGSGGLFYGIGREGGASSRGTIYRISSSGTRTRLVSLTGTAGAAPGSKPRGPLVLAADGNFYGLTQEGGASNTGVIFRLSAAGVYSVRDTFGASGPRSPQGGFMIGSDDLLYATTSLGGTADAGALIRYDPGTNTWEMLGEFTGTTGITPGEMPAGELLAATDGTIYGTTLLGGNADEGVVFSYSDAVGLQTQIEFTGISGTTPGSAGGSDGAGLIVTGGLAFGSDGLLYGVAPSGGSQGGGVVYRLTPATTIGAWKNHFLGDPDAPDLDDPDGDGLTNLVEYALLTDPSLPNPAPFRAEIVNFPDQARLAIVVPRDPFRTDTTIIVEASTSLTSWTNLATSTAGAPFTGAGYYDGDGSTSGLKSVTIRDVLAASSTSRRFIRVRVLH